MNILRYFVIEYSPVFNPSYSTPLTRTARGPNAHAQYEISHGYALQRRRTHSYSIVAGWTRSYSNLSSKIGL